MKVVSVAGFAPATSWSQARRATELRYTLMKIQTYSEAFSIQVVLLLYSGAPPPLQRAALFFLPDTLLPGRFQLVRPDAPGERLGNGGIDGTRTR